MGQLDWTQKVYRLRKLPHHITSAEEAAELLSKALDVLAVDAVVYSLANTCNRLESPPSKVATLQLKSSPRGAQGGLKWIRYSRYVNA
ncbi:unnamed protein product [Clonostachys solani]|uniref:Uncharacterized protein n=1 Tax=Clonostachys solani TaxID=160281 RepID=A0A9N9ZKE5_9HYPO|nr:unnamed protein product [Clonostachys solani]